MACINSDLTTTYNHSYLQTLHQIYNNSMSNLYLNEIIQNILAGFYL